MATTSNYQWVTPELGDRPNVPQYLKSLADQIDATVKAQIANVQPLPPSGERYMTRVIATQSGNPITNANANRTGNFSAISLEYRPENVENFYRSSVRIVANGMTGPSHRTIPTSPWQTPPWFQEHGFSGTAVMPMGDHDITMYWDGSRLQVGIDDVHIGYMVIGT